MFAAAHTVYDIAGKVNLIDVEADSSSSEAFLLEHQSPIQFYSVLCHRRSEVEIFHLTIAVIYEMTEQEVEGSIFTAFFACCYILHTSHLLCQEHQNTSSNSLFVLNHEQTDFLGEAAHEQSHFFLRMNRSGVMILLQNIGQQSPVLVQSSSIALHNAIYVEIIIYCLLCLSLTKCAHTQLVIH